MNIDGHDIGVCSWSLHQPDLSQTLRAVRELGLEHMQLAVKPLVAMDAAARAQVMKEIADAGIRLTATTISFPGEDYSTIAAIRKTGGYLPDHDWPARLQLTVDAADVTRQLGVKLLSTHAGFIPPSNHQAYETVLARLREVSAVLKERDLEMAMETGQERASELLQFLNDLNCPNMRVNFDPANMILYGSGDPIEAVRMLGRHIRHVHVKDAIGSDKPGVNWGKEVPFGEGQVGPSRFMKVLKEVGYAGPLVIEREAGTQRVADIRAAVEALSRA